MRRWVHYAFVLLLAWVVPANDFVRYGEVPEVVVGGCTALRDGVCLLPDQKRFLTIWVDAGVATTPELWVDGRRRDATFDVVGRGLRTRVKVLGGAARVSLRSDEYTWPLPIERFERPEGYVETWELTQTGHIADAEERIGRELETSPGGWARLSWLELGRRAAYSLGRGEVARRRAAETVSLARSLGATWPEAAALEMEARAAASTGDRTAGQGVVVRLLELAAVLPEARVSGHYWAGVLARQIADSDGARLHFAAAQETAEQISAANRANIQQQHALALGELGRAAEALKLVRAGLELDGEKVCVDERDHQASFGWGHLVLASRDWPHDAPGPFFHRVLRLLKRCPDPWSRTNALLSLAWLEIIEERPEDALGWLSEVDAVSADLAPWVDDVYAQAVIAAGRWDEAPPLMQLPDPATAPQQRWNVLVRQARWVREWGFDVAAIERFTQAEALLDDRFAGVSIDGGGELFLADRGASTRGLVEVLLDNGRTADAMCRARMARRRSLARLDRVARLASGPQESRQRWEQAVSAVRAARRTIDNERAKIWELPVDEQRRKLTTLEQRVSVANTELDAAVRTLGVRSPVRGCTALPDQAEGELLLLMTELENGWAIFALAGDGQISVERLGGAELFDPGGRWLDRFSTEINRSVRVRVLPTAASWTIAFAALPFGDGLLIDAVPVEHGLDLPRRAPQKSERTALVVADPSRNLPRAVAESRSVESSLQQAGWAVEIRSGATATRAHVMAALGRASLFHYAGHGTSGGILGWDSALALHDSQRLGIRDILALPSVPHGVVLTGCETGGVDPDTVGGGMNLARAFILSGTAWVIAADIVVADAAAGQIGAILYEPPGPVTDAAAALRRTILRIRRADSSAQWQMFRVIVP